LTFSKHTALELLRNPAPDTFLGLQVALGWICRHESGTYLKFTESGAALFA